MPDGELRFGSRRWLVKNDDTSETEDVQDQGHIVNPSPLTCSNEGIGNERGEHEPWQGGEFKCADSETTISSRNDLKEGWCRDTGESGRNAHDSHVSNDLVGSFGGGSDDRADNSQTGTHDEEDFSTKDVGKRTTDKEES